MSHFGFHLGGLGFWMVLLVLSLFGARTMNAFAGPEKGPLHAPNRFPPHLMFLTPPGNRPPLLQPGRIKLGLFVDYTSVFINEKNDKGQVLMDMEMTMLEFSLGYGISDNMSVQMNLPFVSMSRGFLDPFLEDFHSTLGLSNYAKQSRPDDEFAYVIQTGDHQMFTPQTGGLHLTDSTLALKIGLFDHRESNRLSCSLLYNLKMPTGDPKHGFGSGGFDHGLFLLFRYHLAPVTLFMNPGWILLSKADLDYQPSFNHASIHGLLMGGEYALNNSWSIIAQVNYYTSPIAHKSISPLRDNSMQLTLGAFYEFTSGTDLEFSFSEDLSESAPDFTIRAGISYGFRR